MSYSGDFWQGDNRLRYGVADDDDDDGNGHIILFLRSFLHLEGVSSVGSVLLTTTAATPRGNKDKENNLFLPSRIRIRLGIPHAFAFVCLGILGLPVGWLAGYSYKVYLTRVLYEPSDKKAPNNGRPWLAGAGWLRS